MTPHNEAMPGDYAEIVLIPGDPMRAKWIAETFLDNPRCVNQVRGALGYTGHFRGKPISVQATGMGRPSFTIYLHELVSSYGVKTAIRVGSCGALTANMPLRGIFIAQSSIMDSDLAEGATAATPDPDLLRIALAAAASRAIAFRSGAMVSSDIFYHPTPETRFDLPRARGITAVDMETANLFTLASRFRIRSLSVCTIVDSLLTGEDTPLSERHELFRSMTEVALDVAHAAG